LEDKVIVQSIEQYDDVLKIILKPTKSFPRGSNYFYTDASARELVEWYCWFLEKCGSSTYVIRHDGSSTIRFHVEYMQKLNDFGIDVDHINRVGLDNRACNLRLGTRKQNLKNSDCKGYNYVANKCKFRVRISFEDKNKDVGMRLNEIDAMKLFYISSIKYYGEFNYDFLLDRKHDLDILDDELTGKITVEEATFRHVMRYAKDNAWYVYRYGLEEYFNSRGIQIPAFELDSKGYMIDTITKERLCPFK
jgi:hypothetical protein